MFKPRRIYRRDDEKVRLYSALRKLYEQGVRVCAGRSVPAAKPVEPIQIAETAPRKPSRKEEQPLTLEIDGASAAFDPYNHGAR